MTVNTITAPAVRTRACPLCETPPGEPCQPRPSGDHLARYLDAYTAGHLTRTYMAAVLGELVVIDGCTVIDAGPPVCPEVHPVTGLQCARVFPPHDGYSHIAGDGSRWGEPEPQCGVCGHDRTSHLTRAPSRPEPYFCAACGCRQFRAAGDGAL